MSENYQKYNFKFSNPMKKDFDLIECPIIFNENEKINLYKKEREFKLTITEEETSKKITAQKINTNKKYLIIEKINEKYEITGETNNFYKFNTPADFYVPVSEETKKIFQEIHKNVMSDNFDDYSYKFHKTFNIENKDFPFYPNPLITNTLPSNENKYKDNENLYKEEKKAIIIKCGDLIPKHPKESVKIKKGDEKIIEFLKDLFEKHPIMKTDHIKRVNDKSGSFKLDEIKRCLPIIAYYMSTRPWAKSWIKYEYDPVKNKSSYKYQIISSKGAKEGVQLFEMANILEEIENDPEKYFSNEFSNEFGYFSKYGMALIRKKMKEGKKTALIEDKFEVFD